MDYNLERQPDLVVRITYWQPQAVKRCIASSSRNFVGLMRDGCSVLKYPHCKTANSMETLYEEAARYSRLGPHENLVVLERIDDNGLVFEYCEKGQLEEVIQSRPPLTKNRKGAIGKQITRCLVHLHEHNFIHCDLNVSNVFITSTLDAKIGDLQGQLYAPDGSVEMPTMSEENPKSRHPHAGEDEFSPRTDIFALGTLLYYLWHEHPPFPELDEYRQGETIQAKYRSGEFPIDAAQAIGMDKIILNCWNSCYKQATDVLEDMERLERQG